MGQRGERRVGDRGDGGGARARVEQRQLAEHLAGAEDRQQVLAAVGGGAAELHLAVGDDVELVALVALVEQHLAAAQPGLGHRRRSAVAASSSRALKSGAWRSTSLSTRCSSSCSPPAQRSPVGASGHSLSYRRPHEAPEHRRLRWARARRPRSYDVPARSTGCSRETYPDAGCELDFDNPFELLVVTVLSAQTTDRRVNAVRPTLFAAYPDADRDGAAPTARSSSRSSSPPASSAPRPSRCSSSSQALVERLRRRGAGRAGGPGRRCRAWAARPPTSCWATRSASRASPSTRTSAGWPGASGGPTQTDPVKVEHEVGALFPKKDWTMLSPPPDLARPPGLPRAQPGLRCLPGRAVVPGVRRGADRPGRGGQAREDRGPGVRRLVAAGRWPACCSASCSAGGGVAEPRPDSNVDVDTPQLRAIKADAGVEPCRAGGGARASCRRRRCPAWAAAGPST